MSPLDPNKIGHIKVALCSNNLTHIDTSFTFARQIVFYDVNYDNINFLDVAKFPTPGRKSKSNNKMPAAKAESSGCWMEEVGGTAAEQLPIRVEAMKGCAVLFSFGLTDLAAVRLRDIGIFPVKTELVRDIDTALGALQTMMNNNPPLWLRRALGYCSLNKNLLVTSGHKSIA